MPENKATPAPPEGQGLRKSHMDHRRSRPVQAVSLPRHEKRKLETSERSPTKRLQTTQAAKFTHLLKRDGQGSSSDNSASRWFDTVNKNVETGQRPSAHTSDDLPFFLGAQPGVHPDDFAPSGSELFGEKPHEHNDSENDDLRGVIDDLTVENKRLKTLLKSQRIRGGSSSDAKDRLFELRVHGLSAGKKRELEHLLRNFASTVGPRSTSGPAAPTKHGSYRQNTSEGSSGSGQQATAKTLHTDSGYASHSNPGAASVAVSNTGKSSLPISSSRRNKNVKDYLHDIPDALLPRQPPFMTERAKMILVVRRLEQLFTGKTATSGEHSQPQQQQEISQSAARADASSSNQLRRTEGSREAHMLPADANLTLDVTSQEPSPPQKVRKLEQATNAEPTMDFVSTPSTKPSSPEQRPTRPLDLDIHRAQIADENIEYLRHLGLSSPKINTVGERKERPWIYLNLLIGMAQLHTINVTPAFIRRAIRRISKKFELSEDGHKVRWRGGPDGTAFSREEVRAVEIGQEAPDVTEFLPGSTKRSNAASSSTNNLTSEEPSDVDKLSGLQSSISRPQVSSEPTSHNPVSLPLTRTASTFDYQPMFYNRKLYAPQESYLDSTGSSYSSGGSSDLANALRKSNLDHGKSDEGAITFFKNSYFCSDASADSAPINWKPMRQTYPWNTLGCGPQSLGESPLRHHDACYFTPQFAPPSYVAEAGEPLISFPQTELRAAGEDETQPMELSASGIGGVYPEDNFALDVKVGRQLHSQQPSSERVPFTGSRKRKRYSYRTLRCEKLSLQPSRLPPPSYIFFSSSSSSGNHDTTGDGSASDGSSSVDEEYPAPAAFLNHWSTGSSDDGGDENESSEIDILAMARAADPDGVAAAERAFMLTRPNVGGRVEGSLAATVGASESSSSVDDNSDIRSDVDVVGSDMDVDDSDEDDD